MTDGHAGSLRDLRASHGTAVGFTGVHPYSDVNGTETLAVNGVVFPRLEIGFTGAWDGVSHFGLLGCVVWPNEEAHNEKCAADREAGDVLAPDGDFPLYVGRFRRERGEGVLPKRFFEGN